MTTQNFDAKYAAQILQFFDLPADDPETTKEFARRFLEFSQAGVGDPYVLTGQSMELDLARFERAEEYRQMGVDPQMSPDALWELSQMQPLDPPKVPEIASHLDAMQDGDLDTLWKLSTGELQVDPNDTISRAAWKRMDEAGINVGEDDPRLDYTSPESFLASVEKVIQTEKSIQSLNSGSLENTDFNALWQGAKQNMARGLGNPAPVPNQPNKPTNTQD